MQEFLHQQRSNNIESTIKERSAFIYAVYLVYKILVPTTKQLVDAPVPVQLQVRRVNALLLLLDLLLHRPGLPLEPRRKIRVLERSAGLQVRARLGKLLRGVGLGVVSPDPLPETHRPGLGRVLEDLLHAALAVHLAPVGESEALQDGGTADAR